jgi:hypothetical protein
MTKMRGAANHLSLKCVAAAIFGLGICVSHADILRRDKARQRCFDIAFDVARAWRAHRAETEQGCDFHESAHPRCADKFSRRSETSRE